MLFINYTDFTAPAAPVAVSPDNSFIALGSLRMNDRAGGSLQSYVELRGLRLPGQKSSGQASTVLECSFFVPGFVNPVTTENIVSGAAFFWVGLSTRAHVYVLLQASKQVSK